MSSKPVNRDGLDLPPVRRRERSAPSIGLNLTSMIDVVFLLLVYFLVATDFKQSEEIYRLDLPERREGMLIDPFELDDEPLRILVRGFGISDDDYRLDIEGARGSVQDFQSLYEFLSARRIDGMGGGLFADDHPVLVVPSSDTSWSFAVGAFNAAVRAGYVNITFEESSS